GADRGGDREAHRAEPTGVDPGVRLVEAPVLRSPHLVLADARGEDRALRRRVAELFEAVLRLERGAGRRRLVDERELLLPARDAALPRRRVGLALAARQDVADRLHELLGDLPAVADDRHVGAA